MNVYDEVAKTNKKLIFKEPFYGLMLIGMKKELSNSIETACVTKDNINLKLVVNPEFFAGLKDQTKLCVMKHEMLHIAFFHLMNFKRFPNKKLANIAMDLEINQYIDQSWKEDDWMGLEINKAPFDQLNLEPKKGSKYYYDRIQQEMDQNPEGDFAQAMEGMGDGDSHSLWEVLSELSEAEKKLIQKQIDHQMKEVAKNMKEGKNPGNIPGELKDYIDGLFEEKDPIMDWKAYLRRFNSSSTKVYTKKTRKKYNKRFPGNPALKIKPKKSTLVAIDTSASVSNDELLEFFSEIYHIWKSGTEVTVIECDTRIQHIWEYKGEKKEIKVHGRGGTSFEPVFKYVKEHTKKFHNLIYFTDGEAWVPETKIYQPTLWVHSSRCRINEDLPGAKVQIK